MIGDRTPGGWKEYFDENDGDLFPSDREALLQDYLAAEARCGKLEMDMASITDAINTEARECHVAEAERPERGEIRAVVWRIVNVLRTTEAHCAELESLFALQQTRMAEATRMWQEATGKDVLPDLGDLLGWLMVHPSGPQEGKDT